MVRPTLSLAVVVALLSISLGHAAPADTVPEGASGCGYAIGFILGRNIRIFGEAMKADVIVASLRLRLELCAKLRIPLGVGLCDLEEVSKVTQELEETLKMMSDDFADVLAEAEELPSQCAYIAKG